MAGPLSEEARDIFDRLAKSGRNQADLAAALGLEQNKISKAKTGERQFKAAEVLRARSWFDSLSLLAPKASDQQPTRSGDGGEAVPITSLDLSLSMGPGTLIEEFVEDEPVMLDLALVRAITRTPSDRLRMVRGIGHSMEPTLRTDDRVLIDINERAMTRVGGVYWIDYHGAHGIKRLRPAGKSRILVMSDNAVEPDFEVATDELRIEGRAIWFARGL